MKAHIARPALAALTWELEQGSTGWNALEKAAALVGMKLVAVQPHQLDDTVGQLLGLAARPQTAPEHPAPLREDFPSAVVFSGLSDSQLDQVLAAMRGYDEVIPLKAIVTETNQSWSLRSLLGELYRERQAFAEQQGSSH